MIQLHHLFICLYFVWLMELIRLAITKRILELHDKPLIVDSKAEIGTTFTFLPLYYLV